MLYFFGSDQRDLYSENNVNTVSFPSGLILHYRYREKYIAQKVLDKIANLQGKEGVITFVNTRNPNGDEKNDPPKFFPLRKVVIVSAIKEGERYHFYLKLKQEFANYENNNLEKLQKVIENLAEHPGEYGDDDYLKGKFVVDGPDSREYATLFSAEDSNDFEFIWEKIVDELLKHFKRALFYRITLHSNDPRISENQKDIVRPERISDKFEKGFKIRGGKSYYLKVTFKHRNEPEDLGKAGRVDITDPTDSVAVIQPHFELGAIVDTQIIQLMPKRFMTSRRAYILLSEESNEHYSRFELPLWVRASILAYAPFPFFFVGLILGTITGVPWLGLVGSGISTLALILFQTLLRAK